MRDGSRLLTFTKKGAGDSATVLLIRLKRCGPRVKQIRDPCLTICFIPSRITTRSSRITGTPGVFCWICRAESFRQHLLLMLHGHSVWFPPNAALQTGERRLSPPDPQTNRNNVRIHRSGADQSRRQLQPERAGQSEPDGRETTNVRPGRRNAFLLKEKMKTAPHICMFAV